MRPRSSSKSMSSYAFARLTRYASENLPRAPVRLALLTNTSRKSVGRREWYPDSLHRDFLIDTDTASPAAARPAEPGHAVDAILAAIQAHPGIVLVTLGPLTNVAMALGRAPGIAAMVSRCVIMGGNPCCEGNVTPAAEYNMWVDPEAARVVLRSGLPVELVGWHLCRGEAVLSAKEVEYTLSLDTPLARFAVECNSRAMEAYRIQTGETGISLPDPVAMCLALDSTVCTEVGRYHVDVEVTSDLTRGMTVVDRLGVATDERNRGVWRGVTDQVPPAQVVWRIDNARWKIGRAHV